MTTPFSREQILAMELAAARAWPPTRIEQVEGWQVRLSGGGSRRANSVLPLAFEGDTVDAAIDRVEALYRADGARSYFQVSSIAQPPSLDDALAARGYTHEEPTLLMAKQLRSGVMPADIDVQGAPVADWLAIYCEPLDDSRRAAAAGTLARVPDRRAFLLAHENSLALSSALSVISPDGIAIVECVATRGSARRSGGASRVMAGLEAWSAAHGADTVALQVVERNAPARALYERLGYGIVGRYHYRWRDVA